MAVGLLPGDRYYYHRSRPGAPLWAACEATVLRERVTQGQEHRAAWKETGDDRDYRTVANVAERHGECVDPFLNRGLKPCPLCWPKGAA